MVDYTQDAFPTITASGQYQNNTCMNLLTHTGYWNSGGGAPQWFEVNLVQISRISIGAAMKPNGNCNHLIKAGLEPCPR